MIKTRGLTPIDQLTLALALRQTNSRLRFYGQDENYHPRWLCLNHVLPKRGVVDTGRTDRFGLPIYSYDNSTEGRIRALLESMRTIYRIELDRRCPECAHEKAKADRREKHARHKRSGRYP